MPNKMELQHIIYNLLETQIRFGRYRCGDSLPVIKEASSYFCVSVDTVRLAYVRLRQEGYISLSTCVGGTVIVDYSEEEIALHIRDYFSCRRESLLAFAQSVGVLANYAQWVALRTATPEELDELERICLKQEIPPLFRMSRLIQLLYGRLGNDMLMNLEWQMFLFFLAPFVAIPNNPALQPAEVSPLILMINHARRKDWLALWEEGECNENQYYTALSRFYEDNPFPAPACGEPVAFTWDIHRKASQLCYSLSTDIMVRIQKGIYPFGSYLPSPKMLASEYHVGLNTVRRAIDLLNKLGAVQSVNGVGTRVLQPWENVQNCDFSDSLIRRRLMNFLESSHILSLSCRDCARITVRGLSGEDRDRWVEELEEVRASGYYESLFYICYDAISRYAPWPVIRTVYAGLNRQLTWGLPIRNLHGDREEVNAYFLPYLDTLEDSLRCADGSAFSLALEQLQITETACVAAFLHSQGIKEAADIVLPEPEPHT